MKKSFNSFYLHRAENLRTNFFSCSVFFLFLSAASTSVRNQKKLSEKKFFNLIFHGLQVLLSLSFYLVVKKNTTIIIEILLFSFLFLRTCSHTYIHSFRLLLIHGIKWEKLLISSLHRSECTFAEKWSLLSENIKFNNVGKKFFFARVKFNFPWTRYRHTAPLLSYNVI